MRLSGFRAGLLGTGALGALSVMLALSAATPASASCSPITAGPANGTQTCTGSDPGVSYTATGGNLTVNLSNDSFTGPLIINDDGGARAITVNDGLTGSFTAAGITSADVSGYAVNLTGSGGNVSFTSIKGGTITYNGTVSNAALNVTNTLGGNVALTTGDSVTNTSATGSGITASTVNGALVINAGANITANGPAILAFSSGTGSVTINATGGTITSKSPTAGIAAFGIGTGSAATVNLGDGEILSTSSYGVLASAGAGSVATVTTGKNVVITNTGSGIGGFVNGAGLAAQIVSGAYNGKAVAVTTGSGNTITVTSNSALGVGGVASLSTNANTAVTIGDNNIITVTGNSVMGVAGGSFDYAGFPFGNTGDVNISLGSNDVIAVKPGTAVGSFSFDAGIYAATDSGNVTVNWTGTGGSVSIAAAGAIPTYGIYAATAGASTVNVTVGSGVSISSGGGPAIFAKTGSGAIAIVNSGTINGTISLSTTGSASITNSGAWVLPKGSSTTAASVTNTGLIDLHGNSGGVGDVLTITGPYAGGGKLAIDAPLSTASSATCGALADCLVVGSSSGVTGVVVNNTAAASAAGFNSGGIVIINGASAAGNFVIDPTSPGYDASGGVIDQGLFGYSLATGNNQVRLVSGPGPSALRLATMVSVAQGNFYSSNPVSGRLDWLRDTAFPAGGSDPSTGVWANSSLTIGSNSSTASLATSSGTVSAATSYNQQAYAISAGGDIAFTGVAEDNDELILGALAGYTGADVAFNGNASNGHLSGAQLGGYAGWLDQDWFANADVMANLLSLGFNQNGAALLSNRPAMTVLGFNTEAGKRVMLDDTLFLEPVAALAYSNTQTGDALTSTATLHLGSNNSLRGSLGGRLGTYIAKDGLIYNLSLTARAWNEFDNRENATLIQGAMTAPVSVSSTGTYGEFTAGLKVMGSDSGFGGYANATLDVNGIYNQLTLSAGLRYHW